MKAALAAVVLTLLADVASATVHDLQRDFPTALEDTVVLDAKDVQAQAVTTYERTDDHRDHVVVGPQLQLGLGYGLEARLEVPIVAGDAGHEGSGDVQVTGLWAPVDARGGHPGLALLLQLDLPSGVGSAGVDTTQGVITTWRVGTHGALHANGFYVHDAGASESERRHRYEIAAGYSRQIGADTLLVIDGYRELASEDGAAVNRVEVGLVEHFGKVAAALAAAPGIGEESPPVRVTAGLQYEF